MIKAFARYRIEGSLYFHPTERFTGLKYSHILIHFQFVLLEFTNHRNKKNHHAVLDCFLLENFRQNHHF